MCQKLCREERVRRGGGVVFIHVKGCAAPCPMVAPCGLDPISRKAFYTTSLQMLVAPAICTYLLCVYGVCVCVCVVSSCVYLECTSQCMHH